MAVGRDERVRVDNAVRGSGLKRLRLALHPTALRRLCSVISWPLPTGAVALALRRLVLGGHAAPRLFSELVAVPVALPLLASQLPVPERWRRISWRSCCCCPEVVQAGRRVAGGVGGDDAWKATSRGVGGSRLARCWRRLEHLEDGGR